MKHNFAIRFFETEFGNMPVKEWLLSLPKSHRREIGWRIEVLQERGHQLGMPMSKSLKKGLYELRVPYENVAYRVFYSFVEGNIVLLIHGIIKKSQKTPKKDIDLARKRLAEFIKG